MNSSSRWRAVCFAVQVDEGIDAFAVGQWLKNRQNLKILDLSEQAFTSAAGPMAEFITAEKVVSCLTMLL